MSSQGPREAFFEAFSNEVEMDGEDLIHCIDHILARLYMLGYVVSPAEPDDET